MPVWGGASLPAGTPRPIVERLSREIVEVLRMPEVSERLIAMGQLPIGNTPEEFAENYRRDFPRWEALIMASGAKVECSRLRIHVILRAQPEESAFLKFKKQILRFAQDDNQTMLSAEQNRTLTHVCAGTPMGELLRRYWQPFAAVSELETSAIKPVRIMGEDLVVYRDLSGTYGLVARHCKHRAADLAYGYVEKCGLRCHYHGWVYDQNGQCIEPPFEEKFDPQGRLKKRIRTTAYPVEAKAGPICAYLGSQPAPLLPDWEPFSWKNGFVQIVFSDVPCNWLQAQENSIDPVHFEWMHENWSLRLKGGTGAYAPTHLKIGFDEFEHGFVYKRVREGADEADPLWTTGRVCLWPY